MATSYAYTDIGRLRACLITHSLTAVLQAPAFSTRSEILWSSGYICAMALNYKEDGDGSRGMEIGVGTLLGCVVLSATEPERMHAAIGHQEQRRGARSPSDCHQTRNFQIPVMRDLQKSRPKRQEIQVSSNLTPQDGSSRAGVHDTCKLSGTKSTCQTFMA